VNGHLKGSCPNCSMIGTHSSAAEATRAKRSAGTSLRFAAVGAVGVQTAGARRQSVGKASDARTAQFSACVPKPRLLCVFLTELACGNYNGRGPQGASTLLLGYALREKEGGEEEICIATAGSDETICPISPRSRVIVKEGFSREFQFFSTGFSGEKSLFFHYKALLA